MPVTTYKNMLLLWMCCYGVAISVVEAQEQAVNNLIAFQYDNDVFSLTDRYYSFGNIINYRRKLASNFLLKKQEEDQLQLNFAAGQLGFTPDEFDEEDISLFDYPNAGWLFLRSELVRSNSQSGLLLAFEMGFTGEASFADQAQIAIHDILDIGNTPLWVAQIPTSFLVNFQSSYLKKIASYKRIFYAEFISSGTLGIKDIFLEEALFFSFGNRNRLQETALYNNISSKKEFYGYIGLGYRYVAYNHLIEGSLFNNEAPFTVDIKNHVFKIKAGTSFGFGNNRLKIEHNFNTAENVLSRSHQFTSIVLERKF